MVIFKMGDDDDGDNDNGDDDGVDKYSSSLSQKDSLVSILTRS